MAHYTVVNFFFFVLMSRSCTCCQVWSLPFDVLLTTYDMVLADQDFLSQIPWNYAVIDEAQRLKNPSSVCLICYVFSLVLINGNMNMQWGSFLLFISQYYVLQCYCETEIIIQWVVSISIQDMTLGITGFKMYHEKFTLVSFILCFQLLNMCTRRDIWNFFPNTG